jgi:hypothetical protein
MVSTIGRSTEIFTSDINKHIDTALAQALPSFYVEIIARACKHKPRENVEDNAE